MENGFPLRILGQDGLKIVHVAALGQDTARELPIRRFSFPLVDVHDVCGGVGELKLEIGPELLPLLERWFIREPG